MAELVTTNDHEQASTGGERAVESSTQTVLSGAEAEQNIERHDARSELLYQKIVAQAKQSTTTDNQTTPADAELEAKNIMALADMQTQIDRLVQVAELKGVVYAVQVARKLDLYVLDQVHDQLANHLFEKLVSRGVIEKE